MDARINIPVETETPMGIIQPFRNLGGRFDLGWVHLGEVLTDYVMSVRGEGRRALMTSTSHFSKGDPHRGCAGFNFDTEAARAHTFAIRRQVEQIFGTDHQTVYPLVCGFETDEDALILHGQNGDVLDASAVTEIETPPARPVPGHARTNARRSAAAGAGQHPACPLPKSASTARAELKSRFLSDFAAEVITREFLQLAEKMHRRTAVLTWGSRNLDLLDGV